MARPFVDADDLAEVAVSVLLDPAQVGRVHELTGPRLFTFEQVAAEIGVASGRDIAYRELSVDDYVAALVGAGLPRRTRPVAYVFHHVLDGRNAVSRPACDQCSVVNPVPSNSSSGPRASTWPLSEDEPRPHARAAWRGTAG